MRVWVSTESGLLGQASDLAVDQEGRVYVLDRLGGRLLILSEPGRPALTVGRRGSGPGEFNNPTQLALVSDGFEVLDQGNARVQRFDRLGRYVSSRPTPPYANVYPAGLSPDGHIVVSTLSDTTFVSVYDHGGRRIAAFGKAPARMPALVSMEATRDAVLAGTVPEFFRNSVRFCVDQAGGIWLALLVDGVIERWFMDGTRRASHRLDEPELTGIRRAFFDQYRRPDLRGLPGLSLLADMYAVDTDVWLLLNRQAGEDAVIVRLSATGIRTGRWVLPGGRGAGLLAVDAHRQRVFLVLSEVAEVVELPLAVSPR